MGKLLQLGRMRQPVPLVPKTSFSLENLVYAPSLDFSDVTIPLPQLAAAVKADAIKERKMPGTQPYLIRDMGSWSDAERRERQDFNICFPMTLAQYSHYGFLLMEHFHDLCAMGHTPDEGNMWLIDYDCSPEGHIKPPADFMCPSLYLSTDQGSTWKLARDMGLTFPTDQASQS